MVAFTLAALNLVDGVLNFCVGCYLYTYVVLPPLRTRHVRAGGQFATLANPPEIDHPTAPVFAVGSSFCFFTGSVAPPGLEASTSVRKACLHMRQRTWRALFTVAALFESSGPFSPSTQIDNSSDFGRKPEVRDRGPCLDGSSRFRHDFGLQVPERQRHEVLPMKRTYLLLTALLAAIVLIAGACGGDSDSNTRAAFVMVAPVGDAGWNFMHNEGRIAAGEAAGVETAFVEAIPEGGAEFDNAVQQFIDDGYNVIFTTSFGYMDATERFAADNPDVVFEHISGFKRNDTNFGNTFGRMYQPRYIAGMAAGAATSSNKIGYVAAFPIPEVIRGINAFTLGARSVNPDAQVEVIWTSTWFDPGVEGNSAQALIDAGADVLTMHQDSTATGEVATQAGATFIGYHSDMSAQVGAYLTAPVWDWSQRYTDIIEAVKAGNYTPAAWWGGLAEGVVDISIPSSSPVAAEMQTVKDSIIAGDFDVFDGAIVDQDGNAITDGNSVLLVDLSDPFGNAIGAVGDTMNDGILGGMGFFVEGVIGSVSG